MHNDGTSWRNAHGAAARRNEGIDVLRGIAIFLVVLSHLGMRIPLKGIFFGALTGNGYEAVYVFFVISGFLIAGNALHRSGDLGRIDIKNFYARRFARIVPCLLALVAILSTLHLLAFADYRIEGDDRSLGGAIWAALTLRINAYEGSHGYLPGNWDVLWSLSIEEVFYLVFPIVCMATRRRWILVPLLIALAVSLPWTRDALHGNEIWQEKAYLPGMSAIAIGVLGAIACATWKQPPPRTIALLGWFGAVGLMAVLFDGIDVWRALHDGYLLLLSLSSLGLLMFFEARDAGHAWWRGSLFGWLRAWGRLSYEIYLTHMFVVYAVVRLATAAGRGEPPATWWYVVAIPCCQALGFSVERWFSAPCDRWLRRRAGVTAASPLHRDGVRPYSPTRL